MASKGFQIEFVFWQYWQRGSMKSRVPRSLWVNLSDQLEQNSLQMQTKQKCTYRGSWGKPIRRYLTEVFR
jgi:hypothetical protein